MTLAHYDFKRGSAIHEHSHPQEEVYEVIEGELEVTSTAERRSPEWAWSRSYRVISAIPSKRLATAGVIIVDYPVRPEFD
jgi:oxalate decarboxylase/phosphoglucose isomerase-like protein (cupin superfamily)